MREHLGGWGKMAKAVFRLVLLLPVLTVAIYTLWPDVFRDTPVGGLVEASIAVCNKSEACSVALRSFLDSAPTLNSVMDAIWKWLLNITIDDLINTVVIGGLLWLGTSATRWLRFAPIRNLCAQQLYVASYELIDSYGKSMRAISEIDSKEYLDVDSDIRDELFQIAQQLQVLSEFSIAYEHYFPRKLRKIAVPFRMYVVDAKTRIETMIDDINRKFSDGAGPEFQIELNQGKYLSWKLHKNGWFNRLKHRFGSKKRRGNESVRHVFGLLSDALDLTLFLATKLEGRFRPKRIIGWKLYGRAAPTMIKGRIQDFLYGRKNGPKGLFPRMRNKDTPEFIAADREQYRSYRERTADL